MHLNPGVRKRMLALALSLAFGCVGCGPGQSKEEQSVQELRTLYRTLSAVQAEGTVTADYEDKVYTYSVDIQGNGTEGRMTVTEPEAISGTVVAWSDGALELEVDAVTFETGPLSDSGFSPADAVPALLQTCADGVLLSCAEEELAGEPVLYAAFQSPSDGSCTVDGWFDREDYGLRRAEIAEDGRVVISMSFSTFQMTSDHERTSSQ